MRPALCLNESAQRWRGVHISKPQHLGIINIARSKVWLQLAGYKTGEAAPQRTKDRNKGEEPGLSIAQQARLKDFAHRCWGPDCKGSATASEEP